jgi:hypothetical protein
MRGLGRGRDRVSENVLRMKRILPVDRHDRIERIVHRQMHHRVCADALECKELVYGSMNGAAAELANALSSTPPLSPLLCNRY